MAGDNDIVAALEALDAADDSHWTKDGAPAMEAIQALVPSAKRDDVRRVAPLYTRTNRVAGEPGEPKAPEPTDDLEAQLKAATEKVNACDQAVHTAKLALQAAQHERDKIVRALEPVDYTDAEKRRAENVRRYLQASREADRVAGERRAALQAAGVRIEDLIGGTALDRSFQQRGRN